MGRTALRVLLSTAALWAAAAGNGRTSPVRRRIGRGCGEERSQAVTGEQVQEAPSPDCGPRRGCRRAGSSLREAMNLIGRFVSALGHVAFGPRRSGWSDAFPQLAIETLEDRRLLSAGLSAVLTGGDADDHGRQRGQSSTTTSRFSLTPRSTSFRFSTTTWGSRSPSAGMGEVRTRSAWGPSAGSTPSSASATTS